MSTLVHVRNGRQASAIRASSAGLAGPRQPVEVGDVGGKVRFVERLDVGRAGGAQQDQPRVHRPDPGHALQVGERVLGCHTEQPRRLEGAVERGAGNAVETLHPLRLDRGKRIEAKECLREWKRLEIACLEVENVSMRGGETPANGRRLDAMASLAQDGPCSGFVRRVEEHRPEPWMLGLEAPDHRVTRTNLRPCQPGVVERQHAPNLRFHQGWIRFAEDLRAHDATGFLGDDRSRMVLEIVGDKRE